MMISTTESVLQLPNNVHDMSMFFHPFDASAAPEVLQNSVLGLSNVLVDTPQCRNSLHITWSAGLSEESEDIVDVILLHHNDRMRGRLHVLQLEIARDPCVDSPQNIRTIRSVE